MTGLTRRGRRQAGAAILLVGLTAWSEAGAQSAAPGGGRKFDIDLRARAQYDSNVARGNKQVAGAVGIRPDDIRYNLTAAIDAGAPIGRQAVFLSGVVGYDFYQYNKALKSARIDLTAGAGGLIGPCQTGATVGYRKVLAEDEPLTALDRRNSVRTTKTAAGSVACPLFAGIGQSVSASYADTDFDGGLTLVSSQSTSVSTSLFYKSRTLGTLGVFASYSTTDYGEPAVPTAFPTSGAEIYSLGLQYSRPIGTNLSGSASISRYETKQKDAPALVGNSGDSTGTSWTLGFDYKVNARLSARVGYSDAVSASSRVGSSYQKRQSGDVGLKYAFSQRLSGTVSGSFSRSTFPGSTPLLIMASEEERARVGASLTLKVGQNGRLSVDASHDDVHTDLSISDYTADRVGVTVSATF